MTKAAGRILRNFHDQLAAAYGPQQWWPAQTPLEVIVGAYLTQNTSWRGVERSIANLVEHGVMNLEGLRAIQEDELRTLIRPSGYMVRKAAAIKAFVSLSRSRPRFFTGPARGPTNQRGTPPTAGLARSGRGNRRRHSALRAASSGCGRG